MNQQDKQRYLENWNDERNSMAIYQSLADTEKDPRLAEIYRRMVAVELKHAEKWEQYLKEGGENIPPFCVGWRTRTLIWLSKRIGPEMVLPSIQGMEQNGTASYSQQSEAKEMVADESSHARILNQISGSMRGGMAGTALKQLEGRHRSGGGNALRAAVLGANDGLVSNLSLVMGVAGAQLAGGQILITGIAGLLAGACSMALGEWLSVQSSRELYENQIRIERQEISSAPEEEAAELALIYESRGLPREQAQTLSNQIMSNRETALDTLAREELGIDPEELGGSAWEAAITSFLLFSVGAIVPVIAFIFMKGMPAVVVSIISSTVALFLVGAATSLFTGKNLMFSGMRMVVFGLIAAAITFGIGRLIGGSITG
jgi:vacuolar iron transporter family protein